THGTAGSGGAVSLNESNVLNGTIKVTGQITSNGSTAGGNVSLLANKAGSTTSTIEVDNGISANGGSGNSGQVTLSEINTGANFVLDAVSAPGINTVGPVSATG